MPRKDDCIDNIGQAKYVTKFDLLKGLANPIHGQSVGYFWFITSNGLYPYNVMPFGMKNSPTTFRRPKNMFRTGLDKCKVYIDDAIIYSEEWDRQIKTIREVFEKLRNAKLTKVNFVMLHF